jgi:hypothetical protein
MKEWTAYYLPTPKCRKCITFHVYADHRTEAIRRARELMKAATQGRGVLINVFSNEGESNERTKH